MPIKIIILLIHIYICSSQNQSPALVIEICRHGARGPLYPEYDETWPEDQYNELTNVGMSEHFYLGKALAKRYPEILKPPYNPDTILIRSTNADRTIASAVSQLNGIYYEAGANITLYQESIAHPPYDFNVNILDNLTNAALPSSIYPLPIHILMNEYQLNMTIQPLDCPSVDYQNNIYVNQTLLFAEYLNYFDPIMQEIANWYETINITNLQLVDFQHIGDTMICDYYANRTMPNFNWSVHSKIWNDTLFLTYSINFFQQLATRTQSEIYSVPLFTQIRSFMENVMNNSSQLQFVLLSGHDDTLLPMLTALNITTPACLFANYLKNITNDPLCTYPIFASQMIFELWNDTNEWYVNLYYNDIPAWPFKYQGLYQWTFNEFNNIITDAMGHKTIDDFLAFCTYVPPTLSQEGNIKYAVYAMTGFTGIVFVGLLYTISKKMGDMSRAGGIRNGNI